MASSLRRAIFPNHSNNLSQKLKLLVQVHRKDYSLSSLSEVSSTSSSSPPIYKEIERRVLGVDVSYIETLGSSQDAPPIFFLPGAFGCIKNDFKPMLPYLNKEKYKWLAWDPPSHGERHPRDYCSNRYDCVYLYDAMYFKELLKMLGYQRYTLLCWSGGGITGMSVAAEMPEAVSGLITLGCFGYQAVEAIPKALSMRKEGLNGIPLKRRAQLMDLYGEECLREMWDEWCTDIIRMTSSEGFKKGGSFQETIRKVKCPSLVIQGLRDSIIGLAQAEDLVENLGGNSTLYTVEKGTHNIHLRDTEEMVKCVEDFVDRTTTLE